MNFRVDKDEKDYLNLIHKTYEEHHIQTRLFSMIPYAVNYEKFNGHCDWCNRLLRSRPMYILKIPHLETKQVRYFCSYCASIHEKYIIMLILTKN